MMRSRWWLLCCMVWVCQASTVLSHPGEHEQLEQITHQIEQQADQQILYIRRGSMYASQGQFEAATADFEQAERLGPAVQVALERGLLYYRMQQLELATQYLDRYLQKFPQAANAYEIRARIARDKGDTRQAVADLKRYFSLQDKPNPGTYITAADMLHELNETAQALAILDAGMDALGAVPPMQHRAIELELSRGDTANAIARLSTLRIPLRNSPSWKLHMAELLLLDNRRADAEILLKDIESELAARNPTPARAQLLQQTLVLRKKLAESIAVNNH